MGRPRSEDTEKKAEPKAKHPDTPSGQGLAAAEGKEGAEAAEAYHAAKKAARWG